MKTVQMRRLGDQERAKSSPSVRRPPRRTHGRPSKYTRALPNFFTKMKTLKTRSEIVLRLNFVHFHEENEVKTKANVEIVLKTYKENLAKNSSGKLS